MFITKSSIINIGLETLWVLSKCLYKRRRGKKRREEEEREGDRNR